MSLTVWFVFIIFLLSAGCAKSGIAIDETTAAAEQTTVVFSQADTAVRQPSLSVLAEAFEAAGITNWDGIYKNLTFEQRTALEQYFANVRHENVRFTDEGVLYADAAKIPLTESWQENSILKLVPEPEFGAVFTSWVQKNTISVSFAEVPEATIADYIAEVKTAGFINITAESTSVCCGLVFEADNGNGIKFSLASKFAGSQPVTTITVSVS